jgi:hypothetical protein
MTLLTGATIGVGKTGGPMQEPLAAEVLHLCMAQSLFELCWRTQPPSLTFHLVDGSTFGLWPLFHLRDRGKWTEMTATQHGGTLRL